MENHKFSEKLPTRANFPKFKYTNGTIYIAKMIILYICSTLSIHFVGLVFLPLQASCHSSNAVLILVLNHLSIRQMWHFLLSTKMVLLRQKIRLFCQGTFTYDNYESKKSAKTVVRFVTIRRLLYDLFLAITRKYFSTF